MPTDTQITRAETPAVGPPSPAAPMRPAWHLIVAVVCLALPWTLIWRAASINRPDLLTSWQMIAFVAVSSLIAGRYANPMRRPLLPAAAHIPAVLLHVLASATLILGTGGLLLLRTLF